MVASPDYHAVLGVHPSAEPEVIAAAHKALAKKYHPDAVGSVASGRRFVEIQEAYEVLRDSRRREAYDRWRMRADVRPAESREENANGAAGAKSGERRKAKQRAASPAVESENRPWIRVVLTGALLVVAIVLVVAVTRTLTVAGLKTARSSAGNVAPGLANSGGKSDLTGGVAEPEVHSAPQRPSSSEQSGRQPKQIYDRIVGDQEVEGERSPVKEGPFRAREPVGNRPGEGDGEAATDAMPRTPQGLPGSELPPPEPSPGGDQQG